MIISILYQNHQFVFLTEGGEQIYELPRDLMDNKQSVLTLNGKIYATIKNKYIDLLFFRNKRYLLFNNENHWHVLHGKGLLKLRYCLDVGDISYLIVPHSGEYSNYVTFFTDKRQCGYAKINFELEQGIFGKLVINDNANILHVCTIISSLYLYYKHNFIELFVGYSGLNYIKFNPRWKVNLENPGALSRSDINSNAISHKSIVTK